MLFTLKTDDEKKDAQQLVDPCNNLIGTNIPPIIYGYAYDYGKGNNLFASISIFMFSPGIAFLFFILWMIKNSIPFPDFF